MGFASTGIIQRESWGIWKDSSLPGEGSGLLGLFILCHESYLSHCSLLCVTDNLGAGGNDRQMGSPRIIFGFSSLPCVSTGTMKELLFKYLCKKVPVGSFASCSLEVVQSFFALPPPLMWRYLLFLGSLSAFHHIESSSCIVLLLPWAAPAQGEN